LNGVFQGEFASHSGKIVLNWAVKPTRKGTSVKGLPALLLFVCCTFVEAGTVGTSSVFIPANDRRIQIIGRWDNRDPLRLRHSWPGVSIAAGFSGTRILARMADGDNYYNVTIDGRFHSIFHGDRPGETDYLLAGGLPAGRHSLVLSKRNISFGPVPVFSGLLVEEGADLFEPPPLPVRKIEFIGDSFTAAEGNEATAAEMPWEAKKPVTNIDRGFAKLVGAHFAAQVHTTCRSGIGMVCDWRGDRETSMPKFFGRTLMESAEPAWDFSKWIPDLAVVCLGLNDLSGLRSPDGSISGENSALFRKIYGEFIATLRSVYPGVSILAVAAPPDWIRRNVRQVVDDEQKAGKADIFYAQFDDFPAGTVANGHPNAEWHAQIAGRIIAAMEAIPGLWPGR
jgi:hypothetical protein